MSSHVFISIKPTATSLVAIYTVPALSRATLRVVATNRGTTSAIRVSVAVGGAADSPEQYILYDQVLDANDAVSTAPIMCSAGDIIRVSSASGNVNFHCTGLIQGV